MNSQTSAKVSPVIIVCVVVFSLNVGCSRTDGVEDGGA